MTAIPPEWTDKAAEARERLRDDPAHYFDCDRLQVYDYGSRYGTCDCTHAEDVAADVQDAAVVAARTRREVAEWAHNDVLNVREYGERGTPFNNGARHLAARIALAAADRDEAGAPNGRGVGR